MGNVKARGLKLLLTGNVLILGSTLIFPGKKRSRSGKNAMKKIGLMCASGAGILTGDHAPGKYPNKFFSLFGIDRDRVPG
jgi:hypothetical protein